MRFPSGVIGGMTANFACVHRHQHVIRVFGTAATVISDDRGVRMHACATRALAPSRPPTPRSRPTRAS